MDEEDLKMFHVDRTIDLARHQHVKQGHTSGKKRAFADEELIKTLLNKSNV